LVPVFTALGNDIDACALLVEEARRQAEQDVATAQAQSAGILAQARVDAGAARAKAAALIGQVAAEEDARAMMQARREAAALEEAGLAGIPAVIVKVIDILLNQRFTGQK
jgi:regulator of protease activity HflC (stomatin/prohibitin superfamily)